MKLLLMDNYDSFSYNLYQLLGRAGFEITVRRNDRITLEEVEKLDPDCIVISPGPGTPLRKRYFGINSELILELGCTPILGVCLGHQGIAHAFGARIIHAGRVMHGKPSSIEHDGSPLFDGIPSPLTGGRYHSLAVDRKTLPAEITVTATSEDGEIMALSHRRRPAFGVQFHPESILTPRGYDMLLNFRKMVRGSL